MARRILSISLLVATCLAFSGNDLAAYRIWFPSLVRNGSFEQWNGSPTGWHELGLVEVSPSEPFLGHYAVEIANAQVWENFLYQDVPYDGGAVTFGCAIKSSWPGVADAVRVVFLDSEGNEISVRSWNAEYGDWRIVLAVIRPPDGTATMRIELVPGVDYSGRLYVDHVFMIPLGGMYESAEYK